jgi:hypothetical protein
MNHLTENYDKIYPTQLVGTFDYSIELKTNDDNSILRSYQIITDQIDICHLVCRHNCAQQSPNDTDYFVLSLNIELILFCVQCNFNEIYNKLNHSIVYSFTNLSRDIALIRIRIVNQSQQISFICINYLNQTMMLDTSFHLINQNNTQGFSCIINPIEIHPYHDEISLQCENISTYDDIIVWAITRLSKI